VQRRSAADALEKTSVAIAGFGGILQGMVGAWNTPSPAAAAGGNGAGGDIAQVKGELAKMQGEMVNWRDNMRMELDTVMTEVAGVKKDLGQVNVGIAELLARKHSMCSLE
jgi:hypothetical protein